MTIPCLKKCGRPAIEGQRRCPPCAAKHRDEANRSRYRATVFAGSPNDRRAESARRYAMVQKIRAVLRCT